MAVLTMRRIRIGFAGAYLVGILFAKGGCEPEKKSKDEPIEQDKCGEPSQGCSG